MHGRLLLGSLVVLLAVADAAGLAGQPAVAPDRSGPPAPPPAQPADGFRPPKPTAVPTGHPASVHALAFSPDGAELATTCGRGDPRVRFWDPRTGRLTRVLEAHRWGAAAVAYTPDGARLLTSSFWDTEDVAVWDARTHTKLIDLKGHHHGAARLAISPDGKRLVSIGGYAAVDDVAVWDLPTGRLRSRHPTLARGVQWAAFQPDGRTLVVGETQQARVWDAGGAVGDPVRDLGDVCAPEGGAGRPGSGRPVHTTGVGPAGRVVAVGTAGRPAHTVRLVEVLTGQEVWRLEPGTSAHAVVSPDGRTVARGAAGGGIELLDWASERALLTLRGHARHAYNLAFSPDGRRLATVGAVPENTTVLIWDLTDVAGRPLPKSLVGPGDLDRWCKDLTGDDARAAYRAVWRLAGAPDQAVRRLRALIDDRLRTTPADIARWIADLDHDRFAVREAAAARLTQAGTAAAGPVAAALKESRSAEQRRRLRAVLAAVREAPVAADRLFAARAGAVLEQIGTPEARKLLEEWVRAAPESGPAAAGRGVADRLAKPQQPGP